MGTVTTGAELMANLGIRLADPETVALKIASRLALAQSPEELFSENGANGWSNYLDIPVYVKAVDWMPSDVGEGAGFYAVVEARNAETDEPLVLTTGATSALIQLARGMAEGWFDKPVRMKRADRPTSEGYYPQRLVRA